MFKEVLFKVFLSIGILGFFGIIAAPSSYAFAATSPVPVDGDSQSTKLTNDNLTPDQVSERFNEIDSKYKIGEQFSTEDADFVKTYANMYSSSSSEGRFSPRIGLITDTAKWTFNKSKSSHGVSVHFYGSDGGHINGILPSAQSFWGDTTAKITSGSSKVKSIKTVVENTAYGFIGNSGTYIGMVNHTTLTSSSGNKAKSNYLDESRKYSALLVTYAHVNAYVTVNTGDGSFDLYGN